MKVSWVAFLSGLFINLLLSDREDWRILPWINNWKNFLKITSLGIISINYLCGPPPMMEAVLKQTAWSWDKRKSDNNGKNVNVHYADKQLKLLKMKTILIFVSTLDGKITKWGDSKIRSWSSKKMIRIILIQYGTIQRIIIMGTRNYNPDPVKPDYPDNHFIVMTGNGRWKYRSKRWNQGRIEFNKSITLFSIGITYLQRQGRKRLLIVEVHTLQLPSWKMS